MQFSEHIKDITAPIDSIELYLYNVESKKSFSFGTWNTRQQVYIRITCGGYNGYGEEVLAVNNPDVSLEDWCKILKPLKGMPLPQAFAVVRENINVWSDRLSEIVEMAIVDVAGKLLKQPSIALMGLSQRAPIHGVFVVLSDDVQDVENKIQQQLAIQDTKFIKVKLFGDNALDCAIVSAVRKYTKRGEVYLIGDVNGGYTEKDKPETDLIDLQGKLKKLYDCGLDACEDPAYIPNEQWVTLQNLAEDLALIPDVPMRPAGVICETFVAGMGRIYNIHPGCTGSILDAVSLADCIRRSSAKIMIGDDSLIGIGCTIWQQIAIGLKADWVEATEKIVESDDFYRAVAQMATKYEGDVIHYDDSADGFGIEMNLALLQELATRHCVV